MHGKKKNYFLEHVERGSLKCSVPIFKVKWMNINEHQWGGKRRLMTVLHYATDNTDT